MPRTAWGKGYAVVMRRVGNRQRLCPIGVMVFFLTCTVGEDVVHCRPSPPQTEKLRKLSETTWRWRGEVPAKKRADADPVEMSVDFVPTVAARYEIVLRSREFDAVLAVVRGEDRVASNDDRWDGLPITHAGVVARLQRDEKYTITLPIDPGMSGAFELTVRRLEDGAEAAKPPTRNDVLEEVGLVRDGWVARYGVDHLYVLTLSLALGHYLEATSPAAERADAFRDLAVGSSDKIRRLAGEKSDEGLADFYGFFEWALSTIQDEGAASNLVRTVERDLQRESGAVRLEFLTRAARFAAQRDWSDLRREMIAKRPGIALDELAPPALRQAYGLWLEQAQIDLTASVSEPSLTTFDALCRDLSERAALPRAFGLRLRNNFADFMIERGFLSDAVSYLEDARKELLEVKDSSQLLGAVLINLGRVLHKRGSLGRAEAMLRQAVALPGVESFGASFMGSARNNLGLVLLDLGKREAAREELLAARKFFAKSEGDALVALCDNNLGRIASKADELVEARALYEKGLAGLVAAHGEEHWQVGVARLNLSAIYRKQELFAEALESAKAAQRILDARSPYFATLAAVQHGLALEASENEEEAATVMSAVLAKQRDMLGPSHARVLKSMEHLVRLRRKLEQPAAAWKMCRELVAASVEMTAVKLALAPTEDQFFLSQRHWSRLGLLAELWSQSESRPTDAQAVLFSALSAWKGMVYRVSKLWAAQDRPESAELVDELARIDEAIVRLTHFDFGRNLSREKLARDLARLQQRRRQLQRQAFANLARAGGLTNVPAERLLAAVPAGSALIDFYVLPKFYEGSSSYEDDGLRAMAFVLNPARKAAALVDLGDYESMQEVVGGFLKIIAGDWRGEPLKRRRRDRDKKGPNEIAQERLHESLIAKLAPELEGASKLILVPEGVFGEIPYDAILVDGKPFVDRRKGDVVYYQDVTSFLSSREALARSPVATDSGESTLLAVGGVAYGVPVASAPDAGRVAEYFGRLRGTLPEAESVQASYRVRFPSGQPTLLQGSGATAAAVLRALESSPRFVHMATHGFFSDQDFVSLLADELEDYEDEADAGAATGFGTRGGTVSPKRVLAGLRASSEYQHPGLRTGLVFAGANLPVGPDTTPPFITASRVSLLKLRGCELVVLSGCRTSRGQKKIGEGMQSLMRAFRAAGAKQVVGSLWKVDDSATKKFMDRFYREMWTAGASPARALRKAKEHVRKEPRYRAPRYWAAWILSGG